MSNEKVFVFIDGKQFNNIAKGFQKAILVKPHISFITQKVINLCSLESTKPYHSAKQICLIITNILSCSDLQNFDNSDYLMISFELMLLDNEMENND